MQYKVYVLPSDLNEMEGFVQKNKTNLTEHVITAIEYAVDNSMETIQVFSFKDSDFLISISKDRFLQNVDNIYEEYLHLEKYELCGRITQLKAKMNTVSYSPDISYEKTKK